MYFKLESEFNGAILLRVLISYYTVQAPFFTGYFFPLHFTHEFYLNSEISVLLCLLLCFLDIIIYQVFSIKKFIF